MEGKKKIMEKKALSLESENVRTNWRECKNWPGHIHQEGWWLWPVELGRRQGPGKRADRVGEPGPARRG